MPKLRDMSEREDGFTLIELLVVIIIIGILAAIAIPLFLDQRKLAVDAAVKSDVRNTVANITTSQAVAVSNASTTVNYAATVSPGNTVLVNDTTASTSNTHTAAARTGTLPLNNSFSVAGYNASGKVYTGVSTGAKSYNFSSSTGAFSTVTN